jgi:hypothetical protein
MASAFAEGEQLAEWTVVDVLIVKAQVISVGGNEAQRQSRGGAKRILIDEEPFGVGQSFK